MSTDLEFSVKLPKIRLSVIDVESSLKSSSDESGSVIIQTENNGDDESSCQTPTSEENKIPTILLCPPAPRKQRRTVLCKRKLEFFEIDNFQEVEDFFRSSFDSIEKKRCTACK
ncbi:cyclin-dependent protein kinase inhibitor SMR6-like [Tripterygium wilfordii]|uniref:cyclin-dependent protein kinase inhibitor SMR6-like n=1 Tax=Tripterygium wilfordii TaxID=458696 RepID=UPI0018F81F4A|nr:cyclin-dependent protein kinase inhibitor SMR6-like [Tripterygium wilfordii]